MSVAWISETRKQQTTQTAESNYAKELLSALAATWFDEFIYETKEEGIAALNEQYRDKFDGELRSVPSTGLELRCGPNVLVEVTLISGPLLKVIRHKRVGKFGEMKPAPDHYVARLDRNESLYFEAKDGRAVACSEMSRELLGFLID